MKKKKARKTIVMTMVIFSICLVGWNVPSMAQKTELRLIDTVESHGWALQKLGEIYEKRTGIKVTVELFPYIPTYEKEVLLLATGGADYDLVVLDCPWASLYRENGWILPLNQFMDDPNLPQIDLEGLVPGQLEAFDLWNDKLWAVPVDLTSMIMVYRKDLFEQAGIKEPPTRWSEYLDMLKKLTTKDQFGCILHGGRFDPGWSMWRLRMFGFKAPPGGPQYFILNRMGKVDFADRGYGVKAIKLALEHAPYAPPGWVGLDYPDSTEIFLAGKAATFISWQVFFFEFDDPEKSLFAGKLGYAVPPYSEEQNNTIGGWQMAINAASKHPREAYKFLAWVVSEEGQELMLENGSPTAYRTAALTDPRWINKYPVMAAMNKLKNTFGVAKTKYYVELCEKVTEYITLAFTGQMTPENAIKSAQKEVNEEVVK